MFLYPVRLVIGVRLKGRRREAVGRSECVWVGAAIAARRKTKQPFIKISTNALPRVWSVDRRLPGGQTPAARYPQPGSSYQLGDACKKSVRQTDKPHNLTTMQHNKRQRR